MANVFISYSRRDQQFVRDLHAALQGRGLDTWVDWEDIPLTADFLREIYAAIEAADTFVFVISPESVGSEICGLEIAHAAKHGKRLIPVMRRPGAEKDVPGSLAKLNWIFFRPEDEFAASLDALVNAIATDLDWAHSHTRLLIRAREWESKDKDASLLLRGENLREAEEWLAGATEAKNPQPTPLQREYVLTSRRAESGRLRTLVGAAAAAVCVALVLSVLALVQRGDALAGRSEAEAQRATAVAAGAVAEERRVEAETQRGIAETRRGEAVAQGATAVAQGNARATAEANAVTQRDAARQARDEAVREGRIGQSRELAANAITQLAADPELSMRLAAEAMRIAPTREAEEALRRALGLSFSRLTLRGHVGGVTGVAFAPDGKTVVTGGKDGAARVWDAATGRAIQEVRAGSPVSNVAISPDGKMLVTASDDGALFLWNPASGDRIAALSGNTKKTYALTFSRDGRYVAAAGEDQTARIWETGSGRSVATLEGHTGNVWDVAFSPDGTRAVTAGGDGTARVWEVPTGRSVATFTGHAKELRFSGQETGQTFNRLNSARFSPDNTRVVSASFDGTARVWEAQTGKEFFEMRMYGQDSVFQVLHAAFSPGGTRIVTVGSDGAARTWAATTGAAQSELRGHTAFIHVAAFSPDGTRIITASADKTARLWDAATGETLAVLTGHTDGVTQARFSPDGSRVATTSDDGTGRVWLAGQAATEVYHPAIVGASLGPGDTRLNTVDGLGFVRTWDVTTGAETHKTTWYDGVNSWLRATFSPDAARVAFAFRFAVAQMSLAVADVVVWDPRGGRVVAELRGHTDEVTSITFSPDGTRVLTTSADGTARIWEADTGRQLLVVDHPEGIAIGAFSRDGQRLVTGGAAGRMRVWDATTGVRIAELKSFSVNAVGFSPDGRRVVEGGSDNFIRVWDIEKGAMIAEMRGHTNFVRSAMFSPDGRQVLTAAADGTARVWDASSGQLLLTLRGHQATEGRASVRASFDATGLRIVTVGNDDTARVADCAVCGTVDDLLAAVAARNIREFTAAERARYLPEGGR